MVKHKKIVIIGVAAIIILALLSIWAIRSRGSSMFHELGSLYGESVKAPAKEKSTYAIAAKDFSISEAEFQNLAAQNIAIGYDKDAAEQLAYCQLILQRALYYQAIQEGVSATEEEVNAQIETDRAVMPTAGNADDYWEYIEGTGMTEDEYWDSMRETYQRTMTLAKYAEQKRAEFLTAENDPTDTESWDAYCLELTRQAVAAQDIVLSDPGAWELTSENYNRAGIWPKTAS